MEALPPKTCSVDRLITRPQDIQRVLEGKKRATRRHGRYADPGEIMVLRGKKFEIHKVYRQQLRDFMDEHAKAEGFADVEEYKQYIISIHSNLTWNPDAWVWVHEFRPLDQE
ncbi:ASCH domain-containing protein [Thermoflavimicrobium dichotomicum]|uniref:ASCH domain-containing protein n=1 Tax=Thermoflavimicrobium dichotomicum TaxID=46223 RepID=A0A1I3UTB2_9BACL|nr:ASCH domain-containing protein [Thermoflavimicrobium dichotomicum]SFJ86554.1 ASCH domain-containing protein [Thermoflavimicrobium dichotomicum]